MKPKTVPQKKTSSQDLRTEQLPVQERVSMATPEIPSLPAEQVYTQRMQETPPDGSLCAPAYIP